MSQVEVQRHLMKAKSNGTSEWVMTGGRSRTGSLFYNNLTTQSDLPELDVNKNYPSWSAGIDQDAKKTDDDSGTNVDASAKKLNPNCKPFSPRKPTSTFLANLDENDNVRPMDEDFAKIWGPRPVDPSSSSEQSSTSEGAGVAESKRALNFGQSSAILTSLEAELGSEPALKAKHWQQLQQQPQRPCGQLKADDDFGLRSLATQIACSNLSSGSPTSTIINHDDLGFSDQTTRHFTNSPAYNFMESPFTNKLVTALSGCEYVPEEYMHGAHTASRLPPIQWNTLPTDVLFFFFYMAVGDEAQLSAGRELYTRGWRFNTNSGVWVARFPTLNPDMRTSIYEKGTYQFFNTRTWTREKAYMTLVYSDLAGPLKNPPQTDNLLLQRTLAMKRRESEIVKLKQRHYSRFI